MARDPAFLFYPNDWLGGTMGMSAEQKGAYIDLLVFQFNNKGHFTEVQAKQVLSICFASVWQVVKMKFKTEGENNEFLYNERLREEIIKRQAFSESRRINALHDKKQRKGKKSICKASAKHMGNENRNRIINKNIDEMFILFWKSYPKKKSKGQAEKAFLKINPDEQLLAVMIASVERAKTSEDWIKEKGKYIPHPATWLNAKGWLDEDVEAHPLDGIVSDKTIGTVRMLDEWRPPV
jgi:uncharacterized protein YdaU (DUF1376 family)